MASPQDLWITREIGAARTFCNSRGWDVADVFVEQDSCVRATRRRLHEFLLAAQRSRVAYVVVPSLEWLSRTGARDAIERVLAIADSGLGFVSLQEPELSSENDCWHTMLGIFETLERMENMHRSERSRAVHARALLNGKRIGRPRKGYPVSPRAEAPAE